jgi:hypothetical protein
MPVKPVTASKVSTTLTHRSTLARRKGHGWCWPGRPILRIDRKEWRFHGDEQWNVQVPRQIAQRVDSDNRAEAETDDDQLVLVSGQVEDTVEDVGAQPGTGLVALDVAHDPGHDIQQLLRGQPRARRDQAGPELCRPVEERPASIRVDRWEGHLRHGHISEQRVPCDEVAIVDGLRPATGCDQHRGSTRAAARSTPVDRAWPLGRVRTVHTAAALARRSSSNPTRDPLLPRHHHPHRSDLTAAEVVACAHDRCDQVGGTSSSSSRTASVRYGSPLRSGGRLGLHGLRRAGVEPQIVVVDGAAPQERPARVIAMEFRRFTCPPRSRCPGARRHGLRLRSS